MTPREQLEYFMSYFLDNGINEEMSLKFTVKLIDEMIDNGVHYLPFWKDVKQEALNYDKV